MVQHIQHRIPGCVRELEGVNEMLGEAMLMVKMLAEALEREHKSEKVKALEEATVQFSQAQHDVELHCMAMRSFSRSYQHNPDELTNFDKEITQEKQRIVDACEFGLFDPSQAAHVKAFQRAVWNVHHTGEALPGEEDEDIVVTNTQSNLANEMCPLTGKHVLNLEEPVWNPRCRHVYEKNAILHHLQQKRSCPGTGCPSQVSRHDIVCDASLKLELREMKLRQGGPSQLNDYIEDL